MQTNSIPIYCGDPYIKEIFNTKSFINVAEYTSINRSSIVKYLECIGQQNFNDYRPQFYTSPYYKIRRKFKAIIRFQKMKMQFNKLDFSDTIDQIIAIDKNQGLYIQYLKQPWFNDNLVPESLNTKKFWLKIFKSIN